MNNKIYIYGKSKMAQRVQSFLAESNLFDCHTLIEYPTEKKDGLILSFLDNMRYNRVMEIADATRATKNKTLFVTSFSSRQMVIGTTHLSNESACVDSMLCSLLFQKKKISSKEELIKYKIPAFDKVAKDEFYNVVFADVLKRILNEVSGILSEDNVYLDYVNKVDVISLRSGRFKAEIIFPIIEENNQLKVGNETPSLKVLFSNYLNTENTSNDSTFHKEENTSEYQSIGIVGGGTAGYFTAIALKKKYPQLEVNLIESSKIPVIGVGEATTPILPQFLFEDLKFDKADFYKKVEPTWKLGIQFFWGKPDQYFFNYPFGDSNVLASYLNGNINEGSLNSILMSKKASFVYQEKTGDELKSFSLSEKLAYAYHLDNKKFVEYLKGQADKLGVIHKDAAIVHVENFTDKDGIDYLKTGDGEKLKYSFYVDCSGFRSILMGKAMQSPYISYKDSLFTDAAVVANVPNDKYVMPYTLAESMNHGWCWNTPLRDTDHRGYVYCSSFCSEEEAAAEMRAKNPTMGDHRLIRFRTGRQGHFIKSNVAAIGNSYGFVEPLESTGIHMIIEEVQALRDNFIKLSRDESGYLRGLLNEDLNEKWDYLKWFLALHYKYNKKFDTPFWKAARDTTDVSGLEEMIDVYKNVGLLTSLERNVQQKLRRKVRDPIFGLLGIDTILLGQNVLPKNMTSMEFKNKSLWQYNVSVWNQLAETSVALKEDIEIINNNPSMISPRSHR